MTVRQSLAFMDVVQLFEKGVPALLWRLAAKGSSRYSGETDLTARYVSV